MTCSYCICPSTRCRIQFAHSSCGAHSVLPSPRSSPPFPLLVDSSPKSTFLTSTATVPRAPTTEECAGVVHKPKCESICTGLFRTICGLSSDKWGNKCYVDESSTTGKLLCRQVTSSTITTTTATAGWCNTMLKRTGDGNLFAPLGCSERSVVCRMQVSSHDTTTIRDKCPLLCGACDTTTSRPTAGVRTNRHLTTAAAAAATSTPFATPKTVTPSPRPAITTTLAPTTATHANAQGITDSPRPAITTTLAPTTATHANAQGITDGNDVLLPMWVYVVVCLVVVAAVGSGAYIGTMSLNKRGASASKRKRRVRRRSNLWNSSAGAGASDTGDSDAEDAVFDLGVADFKGQWTPAPTPKSHPPLLATIWTCSKQLKGKSLLCFAIQWNLIR